MARGKSSLPKRKKTVTGRLSVLAVVFLSLSCGDSPAAPESGSPADPSFESPAAGVAPAPPDGGESCHELAVRLDRQNLRVAERTAEDSEGGDSDETTTVYFGAGWTPAPPYGDFVTRHVTDEYVMWFEGITHQVVRWNRDGDGAWVRSWGSRDVCNTL